MGNVFYIAIVPLGRVGQGWVGLALLFTNLIRAQLAHA